MIGSFPFFRGRSILPDKAVQAIVDYVTFSPPRAAVNAVGHSAAGKVFALDGCAVALRAR